MKEVILKSIPTLIGAIVGGFLAFLSSWIILRTQRKKELELQKLQFQYENKRWLREHRVQLYTELIALLEAYNVPVSVEQFEIDKEEVETYVINLNNYINTHLGELMLFLDSKRYSEIYKLRGKTYKLINDKDSGYIDTSIQKNPFFDLVLDAKKIELHLKRDLGIGDDI